jgi:hypothetical protein
VVHPFAAESGSGSGPPPRSGSGGGSGADSAPPWGDVELLVSRAAELPQCPICLGAPEAAVGTACGHVFW